MGIVEYTPSTVYKYKCLYNFFLCSSFHSFSFSIRQWYHFGARVPRLSWQTDLRAGNRVARTETHTEKKMEEKKNSPVRPLIARLDVDDGRCAYSNFTRCLRQNLDPSFSSIFLLPSHSLCPSSRHHYCLFHLLQLSRESNFNNNNKKVYYRAAGVWANMRNDLSVCVWTLEPTLLYHLSIPLWIWWSGPSWWQQQHSWKSLLCL